MELKHYRLIKTIAEEGNLANSSGKLFLTQSALSHQLREMERHLGFKVFFRSRNKWELTEQGKELYKLANQLFITIDKGFDTIQHINNGIKGKIRLGTECYSFIRGIPKLIQKMGILYPDIDVDIILESNHQPISKLLSKDIDIAIVTSKPASRELVSVPLYQDEILAVMNRENHLAQKDYLEAGDFSDIHLIIHSFPLETVAVHQLLLHPNHITPRKISAVPFISVILEMIEANMGITCVPKWLLDSFILSKDIILQPISKNRLIRTQYLVYREEDVSKKYICDFVSNFREEFMDEQLH